MLPERVSLRPASAGASQDSSGPRRANPATTTARASNTILVLLLSVMVQRPLEADRNFRSGMARQHSGLQRIVPPPSGIVFRGMVPETAGRPSTLGMST